MTRPRLATAIATAALLACTPGTALAASATDSPNSPNSPAPTVMVLDRTAVAPFQLASDKSRLLVADGGQSSVSRLNSKGLKKVFSTPEGLSALGVNGRGDVAYGIQQGDAETGGPTTKPTW